MVPSIDMELVPSEGATPAPPMCKIHASDPELIGHDAVFSIVAKVGAKRSGGIDSPTLRA